MTDVGVYLVTDGVLCDRHDIGVLGVVRAAVHAGVRIVQVRDKDASARDLLALTSAVADAVGDRALVVVQHREVGGQQHDQLGDREVVLRVLGEPLEAPHRVVPHVPDEPPGERWQARQRIGAQPLEGLAQHHQRVVRSHLQGAGEQRGRQPAVEHGAQLLARPAPLEVLAALADALDPGVLALIAATVRGAGDDVLVAVCGELAGDEAAVPILIGLGVRELSVAPGAAATVKEAVRAVDLGSARDLAAAALTCADARAVRALLSTERTVGGRPGAPSRTRPRAVGSGARRRLCHC